MLRFLDSINSGNWHLCGDLVKLFAVCPMNSNRLKENVEVNQVKGAQLVCPASPINSSLSLQNGSFNQGLTLLQAPKLIRQLSIDTRLEADIRNQAQQVRPGPSPSCRRAKTTSPHLP